MAASELPQIHHSVYVTIREGSEGMGEGVTLVSQRKESMVITNVMLKI